MANDLTEIEPQQPEDRGVAAPRVSRTKPTRSLPTDRVGFDKQLVILRAYAKASAAADGQAVSNADVSKYADVHAGSISVCNQFWNDVGLLARDGNRNRPDEAVIEFDQASEWNPERAGVKLARVLEGSWFAQALTRKLALRSSIPRAEAVEFLAEEARAGKEYRLHLEMLIDYLRAAGLVIADGTNIARPPRQEEDQPPARTVAAAGHAASSDSSKSAARSDESPRADVERFSIPLPGKSSVVIEMPKDLDHDDWVMLGSMLAQYIRRWKKFKAPKDLEDATAGDDDLA